MKKAKKFISIFMAALCLSLFTPECLPFSGTENAQAAEKINKKKLTLTVGQKENLKITGTKKKVKWSSSKKNIATVNAKGLVTAKEAGKTVITAKYGKKKKKCTVTVKPADTDIVITAIEINSTGAFSITPKAGMTAGEYFKNADVKLILKAGDKTLDAPPTFFRIGINKGHGEQMPDDTVLEAGKTYNLNIGIMFEEGYKFDYKTADCSEFAGTISIDGTLLSAGEGFSPSKEENGIVIDAFITIAPSA